LAGSSADTTGPSRGFAAPRDADWQIPGTGDIICHNDLYGGNVVLRGDLPVALIDWEMAGPGTQLTDLASAACFWTPLCSDADADRRGLPRGRRGERLRLLCDVYGLSAHERGSLLDAVTAYLLRGYELHRRWGGLERRPKWRRMWDSGSGEAILDNAAWLNAHPGELARWL
jgi:aminoglycoside phosphotransferase (APT) family kinase protein